MSALVLLLTIICLPPDRALQETVRTRLERCRVELVERWGLRVDAPEVILAGTRAVYDEQVALYAGRPPPSWSRAVALPGQNRIILDSDARSRVLGRPLGEVLAHELCHLALGPWTVPRWFDEGLAELAAGRVDDLDEQSQLQRAAQRGLLRGWEALGASFPSHEHQAELAYAQAFAFVRFVDGRGLGVAGILAQLEQGAGFESAVASSCGASVEELQRAWEGELLGRYSFLSDLAQQLGLYGFLALLVVVAWVVQTVRWRKKRELLPE